MEKINIGRIIRASWSYCWERCYVSIYCISSVVYVVSVDCNPATARSTNNPTEKPVGIVT